MGEIAAASAEQSQGIGQVNQAVSEMDRTTQHNAAYVEEAAAAAQALDDQSKRLVAMISSFIVCDDDVVLVGEDDGWRESEAGGQPAQQRFSGLAGVGRPASSVA